MSPRRYVEGAFSLLLQTCRRPSFEPARYWGVYVRGEEKPEALVLTVTSHLQISFDMPDWLQPGTGEMAVGQGAPGLVTARVAAVHPLKLRGHLRTGRRLPLPVPGELPEIGLDADGPTMGMDGTMYGFRWEAGFSAATLQWWEQGPKEWQRFTKWVVEFQDFLARCG